MNYLKHFENHSDQTYDFIYSNFLEIADEYNFAKVDDVFESDIQDTVYEIRSRSDVYQIRDHNCYLIKIFFEDNLSGVSDDGKNLSYKFRSSLDNFSNLLMREDLKVKIDYSNGSLIMDIYIMDFLKKQNESNSVDDFDELKDIFLDLHDDGFEIKFYNEDVTKSGSPIYRIVIKNGDNFFDINDCLSVLKRAVEYMQGLGYDYRCAYVPVNGGNCRFFVKQEGAYHMGHRIAEKIYRIHISFNL